VWQLPSVFFPSFALLGVEESDMPATVSGANATNKAAFFSLSFTVAARGELADSSTRVEEDVIGYLDATDLL
jgi:hypothetical protein